MKVDKCLGDQFLIYKIGPPNRNWGAFAENTQIIARYATKRRGQSQSCIVLARGTFGEVSRMRLFYSSAFLSRMESLLGAAVAEWLSSWFEDKRIGVRFMASPLHFSEIGYLLLQSRDMAERSIAKSTLILKTTNHPTMERLFGGQCKKLVSGLIILLHLGLVSSNWVAGNASRNCPLSEHRIPPPDTLRGQWPPLQEHSNNTVALNTPFRSLLSSSYKEWIQLGRFHQISDTFLTSQTIYLPIIGILLFIIYTA